MSADQVFRLPDLGEGLTEAEVIQWRVAVGDTVTVDEVVVEVETAKAAVEVPVPFAGTVAVLHAEAGSVLAVGEPLITVAASAAAPDGGSGPAEQYRTEERAGSGNVLIGYGTGHAPASRRRARRGRTAGTVAGVAAAPVSREPAAPRVISPLVRKLAREHGVDLAAVVPGGHGVIRRRDVEEAIAAATGTAAVVATGPAAAARPVAVEAVAGIERIPLRGVRRAVADKLARSRSEIPDATTWVDVDATGLIEAKNALADRGVSLLALLARICVAGLRRFPELNSTVDLAAGEILRLPYVNLGFAAQTDRGLMVPVVQGAHLMNAAQLGAELSRLAGLARAGTLPPAAMTGGTFTLNNYGVFGVDGSNAIINHPEAGILGVGRIVDKPWVVDGQLAVRKVTQLSLSFDHRVCDGGAAGGFLRYVADCVEKPAILLADL
ncbi:dihydrolipoamide acetyltransferase family protein [Couchioplanes caeruleus]|uniref:Dihydrolipoamide acetyltransferase component of pyruvate dehydrogenase complex n=2 Tax=Couchioplanes caeruleus TaxID=56438 RepID=A0A1K0FQ53_9ACTN|nr:dihydrolipoamide acetyltransferase family protein [Couchioplanes caeruleus]OJF14840.1 branched-chain alpha-keto acid dehydrogenase subunit E2 [Couchioplanes caeruleus subsp. caeruleus]ROP28823.1 pyruvate dehydrogenase E2 component (dihydrolipoamide acetyltransferase) [Couchioplanes caeruleus]